MKRIGLIVLLLAAFAGVVQAQPDSRKKKGTDSVDAQAPQDTLPLIVLDNTVQPVQLEPMTKEERTEWNRMVWRVDIVWPEVQKFLIRLNELETQLAALDKKSKKRKAIKAEVEQLKGEFADKLKDYSYQQGQVVINLIHRQTGRTAYDLIKDYKSSFTATSYQVLAKVNGLDLKDTYDPNSEEDQLLAKVLAFRGL
jgi:hypothetical protein